MVLGNFQCWGILLIGLCRAKATCVCIITGVGWGDSLDFFFYSSPVLSSFFVFCLNGGSPSSCHQPKLEYNLLGNKCNK